MTYRTGFVAIVLLTTSLVADPSTAYEITKEGAVKLWYRHSTTCGQYAEDRRLPPNVGNHASDRVYVAGWLSAYDALVPGGNTATATLGLMIRCCGWIGFCLDHPFGVIQTGLPEFSLKIASG
jgi:hypothetical protein